MHPLILTCTTPVITAYGATTNLVTEYTAQVCISAAQHGYLDTVSSVFFQAAQFFNGLIG